jgi:hypothetical protein
MLQGEPSIRRSPCPRKRISYAEIDSSDEESESRKIRRTNKTTNSQSTESPQPPRTPPQASRDLTSLTTTPNKRPINNEEIFR